MVGAEAYATAGSPDKRAFLASIGVKHVMCSRDRDFVDEVRAATGGRGVDLVLNSRLPLQAVYCIYAGAVSFLCAWLSWHLAEKHFLRLKKLFH